MQNEMDWQDEWNDQPTFASAGKMWIGGFLLVALVLCVAGAVLVPGGLGIFVGYQQLQEQNHEAAIVHFNRGLGYLAENYPELARAEFEVALKYDSDFEPARQKLGALMNTGQNGAPGAPQEDRVATALLDEARGLIAQKQWSDAITRLEQIRTLQPEFRNAEVRDLLYQAYVNSGKAAIANGQIELARERFDGALAIRSDPDVQKQRELAMLYLEGQQAFGYNWRTAIQKFAALYQQDPNYDDVRKKLFDAYGQYGDIAAKQGSPCLAVQQYDGALALLSEPALAQKRAATMTLCKQAISATPTPANLTGVENFTWKVTTATDRPCAGVGDLTGVVRDALGRPLPNVSVGYYADGIPLVGARTNNTGQYQFTLGKDPGILHVTILGADGKTPATLAADVPYPGGNTAGCHLIVEWQKIQ